jgi:hypothetical protein
VILPLISFLGSKLVALLNSKIKSEKVKEILGNVTSIITSNVESVFQTFVESLKNAGKFDSHSQQQALEQAFNKTVEELSSEAKDYITSNYGDLRTWVVNQIEATIYTLKK